LRRFLRLDESTLRTSSARDDDRFRRHKGMDVRRRARIWEGFP
jgi:hypothetical protein